MRAEAKGRQRPWGRGGRFGDRRCSGEPLTGGSLGQGDV